MEVTLHSLKFKIFHELMTSKYECLDYDSSFVVTAARKAFFMSEPEKELGSQSPSAAAADAVMQAFPDKEVIPVLVCKSIKKKAEMIFPIVKQREADSKIVKKIYLIDAKNNCERIPLSDPFEAGGHAPLINTFYTYAEEFGDHKD